MTCRNCSWPGAPCCLDFHKVATIAKDILAVLSLQMTRLAGGSLRLVTAGRNHWHGQISLALHTYELYKACFRCICVPPSVFLTETADILLSFCLKFPPVGGKPRPLWDDVAETCEMTHQARCTRILWRLHCWLLSAKTYSTFGVSRMLRMRNQLEIGPFYVIRVWM